MSPPFSNRTPALVVSLLGWILSCALASWPLVALAQFVFHTGSNVHSNDYVLWVPLVGKIAGSDYDWLGYFRDSFQGGCHSFAIPILLTLAIAQLTQWSIHATLLVGLFLSVLKLAFLHSAFTANSPRWLRMVCLPLLSFLLFSSSNVDVFSFGFTVTHVGLAELAFAVAIWSVVRVRRRELAVSLGILSAVIATLSWGSGLMVWPVLCCALWASGDRQKIVVAAVAGWWLLAALPYLFLTNMAETAPTARDPWLPLEVFGWSWSANFDHPRARVMGGVALVLFAVVAIVIWQRRARIARFIPGLACMAYAMGLMALIAVFRGQLAVWYSSTIGFFWVGLLGVFTQVIPEVPVRARWQWGVPLCVSFVLLWATNGDFGGKARYLLSRGYVAASCLRNFRTAPAVCEGTLFQWKRGNPQNLWVLGEVLERHGWGVFGPEQVWSLQGDFAFENTEFFGSEPRWVTPDGVPASPTNSFEKLDLILPKASRVEWQLALPPALQEARLRTVVSNATRVRVWLSSVSGRELLLARAVGPGARADLDVQFGRWAGQSVTLSLELDEVPGEALKLQFPRVEVSLAPGPRKHQLSYAVPLRTDTGHDLVIGAGLENWNLRAVKPAGNGRFDVVGTSPTLTLKTELSLCAADYSRLVVKAATSPEVKFRELHVMTRNPEGPSPSKDSLYLSMFSGSPREYSFNLRLLGLPVGALLPTIALRPPPGAWFELSEVRLARREGLTRCRTRQ
ncbi:MAG: hypothetical protein Q8L14_27500 [Myxococcales bacterium]|nr:hypothetical protein [Myxococcales bacterium]